MTGLTGITAYGAYLPRHRVDRADLGSVLGVRAGEGGRVAASYDEDSTTMAVEAARRALVHRAKPDAVYLATTSPAYFDKTNATAVHAALGLGAEGFAADLAGSARSSIAAFHAAARSSRPAAGGLGPGSGSALAVLSDVRTGRPGSADERDGGDGAAAFVFGPAEDAVAVIVAEVSATEEFLDRWRAPGAPAGGQWEERFGLDAYLPLVTTTAERALEEAGLDQPDHVVLSSVNPLVSRGAAASVQGRVPNETSLGQSGAADLGLRLADVLDRAREGETILVVSAADGCDAFVLRVTAALAERRAAVPVAAQLEAGRQVPYATYLTWRGFLDREPPRRPEPDRAAAPPSRRSTRWKYGFCGSQCTECGFVHLPPSRICKGCGAADRLADHPVAGRLGTVVTFTADRLAYSPSPPLIDVVVDFDGGGRCTLELADARPEDARVGLRVEPTFRRLGTAGGVHNYFWKVRPHG
jgi:3-hydroxy-3-methylglutaryl CoA synthase/uncharacterized OB-fold protein